MGERKFSKIQFEFNKSIKIIPTKEMLSPDAGTLLLRAIDEQTNFTLMLTKGLIDPRDQSRIKYGMHELIRERLFCIAQGFSCQDDADRLAHDPAFLLGVSELKGQNPLRSGLNGAMERLASQPTQSRLVETLSSDENRATMREFLAISVGERFRASASGYTLKHWTIEIDTFPIKVYGEQAGSAHNGHYGYVMYNVFIAWIRETGDIIDTTLKPGNAHTSDGADEYLAWLIDLVSVEMGGKIAVCHDAGFQNEENAAVVEERGSRFVCRIKRNAVLERLAQPLLNDCMLMKPGEEKIFELPPYRAGSWSCERRIVLVAQGNCGLFPDYFFLCTNYAKKEKSGLNLLEFYRERGAFEGMIGEFKSDLKVALSCTARPKSVYDGKAPFNPSEPRTDEEVFACNEATLLLFAWGYNLANLLRRCVETAMPTDRGPAATPRFGGWSLKRVRQTIQKVAARFVMHARRVCVMLTENACDLWEKIWPEIENLPKVSAFALYS